MSDLEYQLRRQAQMRISAERARDYWKGIAEYRGRIAIGCMFSIVVSGFSIFIGWCFGGITF